MTHPEWMAEGMRAIRDQAFGLLERHEREEHDGEVCVDERVGFLAYLAHSIGFPHEDRLTMVRFLAACDEYAAAHHEREENGRHEHHH